MFHPKGNGATVLVLLYSHIFIDDPFYVFREFNPPPLIRQKPFPFIPEILVQFSCLFTSLIFFFLCFYTVCIDQDILQQFLYFLFL